MEEKSLDLASEIAGDGSWAFSSDGGFFYCTEREDIALEIGSGFPPFDLSEVSGLDMIAPPQEKRSPPPPPRAGDGSGDAALSSSTGEPPMPGGMSPETSNKINKKGQKRVPQPRFAFMTKSDIDHLEDGYRWRKYGQKAVKNSPFPRSYYRCTNSKCMVKKLIQRSSEDPTVVITTYEGQHCHHSVAVPRSGMRAPHAAPFMERLYPLVPSLRLPATSLHGNQPMAPGQLVQSPHKEQYYSESQPEPTPPLPSSDEGLLDDIMLSTAFSHVHQGISLEASSIATLTNIWISYKPVIKHVSSVRMAMARPGGHTMSESPDKEEQPASRSDDHDITFAGDDEPR